jgi:heterodisulfide reductase subunit C
MQTEGLNVDEYAIFTDIMGNNIGERLDYIKTSHGNYLIEQVLIKIIELDIRMGICESIKSKFENTYENIDVTGVNVDMVNPDFRFSNKDLPLDIIRPSKTDLEEALETMTEMINQIKIYHRTAVTE